MVSESHGTRIQNPKSMLSLTIDVCFLKLGFPCLIIRGIGGIETNPPDFSRHVRSIRQASFRVRSTRRVDSTGRRRSRAWCGISNTINERAERASPAQTDRRRVLRTLRPKPGPKHHVPLRSTWCYRYVACAARSRSRDPLVQMEAADSFATICVTIFNV